MAVMAMATVRPMIAGISVGILIGLGVRFRVGVRIAGISVGIVAGCQGQG